MSFFKYPIDRSLACGSFTLEHILFIIVCLFLIGLGLYISIKKVKNLDKFLFIIGIIVFYLNLQKLYGEQK
jgi:hypothetical protein